MFAPNGQLIARVLGARGPAVIAGGAEASGMAAVAAAERLIATGAVDVVIAGAAQSLQRPLLEHLAGQSFATTTAARPFDRRHDGMVPAEGAACIVLEAEEHARTRGAAVLARVEGLAEVFDPAAEPLALTDAGEVGRGQQAALTAAGYVQNQVDLLVSCADGRPAADFAEGFGALRTFGRHAFFAGVTAPAGALGNTLAASGPIAIVCALEALRRQSSFPVAGLEDPEEGVDLAYVRQPQPEKLDCVLVTSLGLGGAAFGLVLRAG
jgi:3-oxoacyl-[acyl-carrier-protein] synthase II